MVKLKNIAGISILAAGTTISGLPGSNAGERPLNHKEIFEKTTILTATPENAVKRTAQKVYHRFEEIPELTDQEASLYKKTDYTYIVNADLYRQTGSVELKRVLKKEVTSANTLSLVYRSECASYNPKENEDQLAKYVIDLRVMSKTGIAKGPSQMQDPTVVSFLKYVAVNPQTRAFAMPLFNNADGAAEKAAAELEKEFFAPDGTLLPMDKRNLAIHLPAYKKLRLKNDAWQTIASPRLKKFIEISEKKMSQKANKTIRLTDITKSYLCLTELFPEEELLKQTIEDYNLAFYQLGRPGKTKHVMAALALSLNYKDSLGNLNATRIPPYAVSAAVSHINWKGNGSQALREAQKIRSEFKKHPERQDETLKKMVRGWVTGKSKVYGVDELSKLNIITPDIIRQYQEIELPGAKEFAIAYQKAVALAEEKVTSLNLAQDTLQTASAEDGLTKIKEKGKTLFLTAKDFINSHIK